MARVKTKKRGLFIIKVLVCHCCLWLATCLLLSGNCNARSSVRPSSSTTKEIVQSEPLNPIQQQEQKAFFKKLQQQDYHQSDGQAENGEEILSKGNNDSVCDERSEFHCELDESCVPLEWHCDFTQQCLDGQDELNCVPQWCNFEQDSCQWRNELKHATAAHLTMNGHNDEERANLSAPLVHYNIWRRYQHTPDKPARGPLSQMLESLHSDSLTSSSKFLYVALVSSQQHKLATRSNNDASQYNNKHLVVVETRDELQLARLVAPQIGQVASGCQLRFMYTLLWGRPDAPPSAASKIRQEARGNVTLQLALRATIAGKRAATAKAHSRVIWSMAIDQRARRSSGHRSHNDLNHTVAAEGNRWLMGVAELGHMEGAELSFEATLATEATTTSERGTIFRRRTQLHGNRGGAAIVALKWLEFVDCNWPIGADGGQRRKLATAAAAGAANANFVYDYSDDDDEEREEEGEDDDRERESWNESGQVDYVDEPGQGETLEEEDMVSPTEWSARGADHFSSDSSASPSCQGEGPEESQDNNYISRQQPAAAAGERAMPLVEGAARGASRGTTGASGPANGAPIGRRGKCARGKFECSNGICLPGEKLCNFVDDCMAQRGPQSSSSGDQEGELAGHYETVGEAEDETRDLCEPIGGMESFEGARGKRLIIIGEDEDDDDDNSESFWTLYGNWPRDTIGVLNNSANAGHLPRNDHTTNTCQGHFLSLEVPPPRTPFSSPSSSSGTFWLALTSPWMERYANEADCRVKFFYNLLVDDQFRVASYAAQESIWQAAEVNLVLEHFKLIKPTTFTETEQHRAPIKFRRTIDQFLQSSLTGNLWPRRASIDLAGLDFWRQFNENLTDLQGGDLFYFKLTIFVTQNESRSSGGDEQATRTTLNLDDLSTHFGCGIAEQQTLAQYDLRRKHINSIEKNSFDLNDYLQSPQQDVHTTRGSINHPPGATYGRRYKWLNAQGLDPLGARTQLEPQKLIVYVLGVVFLISGSISIIVFVLVPYVERVMMSYEEQLPLSGVDENSDCPMSTTSPSRISYITTTSQSGFAGGNNSIDSMMSSSRRRSILYDLSRYENWEQEAPQ